MQSPGAIKIMVTIEEHYTHLLYRILFLKDN